MWPRCDERGINPTYELDVYICQLQFGRTHLSAESRCLQTSNFKDLQPGLRVPADPNAIAVMMAALLCDRSE